VIPPADDGSVSGAFQEARPRDLHSPPPPWHRLAHIVRTLVPRLTSLAAELPVPAGGTVLDYGCADAPYRHAFGPDVEYLAADLPGNPIATIAIAADGTLPLADGSVDAVLSTQVLEHVADPARYLAEVHRVTRPGGKVLLSTHGAMFYHPDPVDYWRWTCAGLRRAVEDAGLRVVTFEGIVGPAAYGFQLIQETFYYRVPLRLRPVFALVLQALARVADRFDTRASRDMNACVFALIAERP